MNMNTNMNWKPEVLVEGKWYQNGLTFATQAEAEASAKDLFNRWMACAGHRAVEVDAEANPVNYAIVDGELVRVGAI